MAIYLALLCFCGLAMAGCGSKDETNNDPNYYKGTDFKGAGHTKGTMPSGASKTAPPGSAAKPAGG